ncbi:NEDD8 ultimate buster 1-like, partial [Brachionus plicatilis]
NLESLNDLKNAEERLKICEDGLKRCYGSDLSRLMTIKSDMVNKYTPIFVRLNLLKAILKYYRGKKNETRQFLDTAMQEMKKILVDDDKVAQD